MAKMSEKAKERLRAVQAARRGRNSLRGYDQQGWQALLDQFADPDATAREYSTTVLLGMRYLYDLSGTGIRWQFDGRDEYTPTGLRTRESVANAPGYRKGGVLKNSHAAQHSFGSEVDPNGAIERVSLRHIRPDQLADLKRMLPHDSIRGSKYAGPDSGVVDSRIDLFRAADILPIFEMLWPVTITPVGTPASGVVHESDPRPTWFAGRSTGRVVVNATKLYERCRKNLIGWPDWWEWAEKRVPTDWEPGKA